MGHDNGMGSVDVAAYQGGRGLRITDMLALAHVPRWSIVSTMRPQSVAEHTFNAMVIFTELCRRLDIPISAEALLTMMHHDADESRTADIPASVKDKVAIGKGIKYCPWLSDWTPDGEAPEDVVKVMYLADQIEALVFVTKYGVGPHADRVADSQAGKLQGMINASPVPWHEVIEQVVGEILSEDGR